MVPVLSMREGNSPSECERMRITVPAPVGRVAERRRAGRESIRSLRFRSRTAQARRDMPERQARSCQPAYRDLHVAVSQLKNPQFEHLLARGGVLTILGDAGHSLLALLEREDHDRACRVNHHVFSFQAGEQVLRG
jgi:hypothetical protein